MLETVLLRWGETEAWPAPGSEAVVGRDPSCDLVIDRPMVSRRHVRLEDTRDGWVVEDQSSNGTYLDGARIGRVAIGRGLVLRLGHPAEGPILAISPASSGSDQPQGAISIGRDPENALVVDDLMASRHHAQLRPNTGGLEIVDLGSQNGTFVNGVRVTVAPVHLGDEISIGGTSLKV